MADKPEMVRVKSGLPDNRVALHERHPDHPANAEGEHEVFIYGDQEFEAAKTAEVGKHLASGELVEVKKARKSAEAEETSDEGGADQPAGARKSGGKAKASEGDAD